MSEAESEMYQFGVESASIRKSRIDILPCGVYATNKRIFLVRSPARKQVLVVGVWVTTVILVLAALAIFIQSASMGISAGSIDNSTRIGYPLLFGGLILLAMTGVIQWSRNSSAVPIQELERREIYEIDRSEISSVEMNGSDFWTSRIRINLKSGQSRSILFSLRGTFERVKPMFSQSPTS